MIQQFCWRVKWSCNFLNTVTIFSKSNLNFQGISLGLLAKESQRVMVSDIFLDLSMVFFLSFQGYLDRQLKLRLQYSACEYMCVFICLMGVIVHALFEGSHYFRKEEIFLRKIYNSDSPNSCWAPTLSQVCSVRYLQL